MLVGGDGERPDTSPRVYNWQQAILIVLTRNKRRLQRLYRRGRRCAFVFSWSRGRFCLPNLVTNGQLTDITTSYMRAHSEIRNKPAAYLVKLALTEAFPASPLDHIRSCHKRGDGHAQWRADANLISRNERCPSAASSRASWARLGRPSVKLAIKFRTSGPPMTFRPLSRPEPRRSPKGSSSVPKAYSMLCARE